MTEARDEEPCRAEIHPEASPGIGTCRAAYFVCLLPRGHAGDHQRVVTTYPEPSC